MRSLVPISIFAFLLITLSYAQVPPIQAHSFNNVDYMAQLLIKGSPPFPFPGPFNIVPGVDSFKIDINAAVKDSCTTYSTWKTGDNKCETDDHNNLVNSL